MDLAQSFPLRRESSGRNGGNWWKAKELVTPGRTDNRNRVRLFFLSFHGQAFSPAQLQNDRDPETE